VPRDPVLLLGDSYAQGFGDWLLENNPNGNGPFHSAHVVHALSGRDVVTLGLSGAGSAEALVALPATAYVRSGSAWYLRLPPPHVAVVYFYEGNDLTDNLNFLKKRVENPEAADVAERIDRALAGYPATLFGPIGWWQHFPLLRFSVRLTRSIYTERFETDSKSGADDAATPAQSNQPNIVEVAGQSMELPASLQSPALELTHGELKQAVLVYERALAFLRRLLPNTPVLVVYLPSPLSTYRIFGPEVSIQSYLAVPCTTRKSARPSRATPYVSWSEAQQSATGLVFSICALPCATPAHMTSSMALATSSISIARGWKCWGRRWPSGSSGQ
jgi:hypothetical protein